MKDRDFSDPGTKFVEITPDMERKERAVNPPGSSLMASWNGSENDLDPSLFPPDKLKLLQESRKNNPQPVRPSIQPTPIMRPQVQEGVVVVPIQALKKFKAYLDTATEVKVYLKADEAIAFLNELSTMKTPTVMSDAKAIIKLSDQLERIIGL